MALRRDQGNTLIVRPGERLVSFSDEENGVEIVRYHVETVDSAPELDSQPHIGIPLEELKQFAGMWSDLDWDEMEAGLEEIRRSSKPSAPIEDV